MRSSLKKVEVLQLCIKQEQAPDILLKTEDIIQKVALCNEQYPNNDKESTIKIYEDHPDYLFGIVTTTMSKGIPPKQNKQTKIITPLDLPYDEDLVYANAFLFYKRSSILFYEFNRNGCYVSYFKSMLVDIGNSTLMPNNYFNLTMLSILRKDRYNKVLKMKKIINFEVEVANPRSLRRTLQDENEAISKNPLFSLLMNQAETGESLGTESIKIEYKTEAKSDNGLSTMYIYNFVNWMHGIIKKQEKKNISHVKIKGYIEDETRATPVDLIADLMSFKLKLSEQRLLSDLQIHERKEQMISIYTKAKSELDALFS